MFRIGEFSRIARVSCRLLRYYDELGLLQPALTDRDTGYRYYRANQLSQLNRILVLRDLGLSLEQIVRLLDQDVPAAELRDMLEARRAEMEQSILEQSERLHLIGSRLAQLEMDGEMDGEMAADDVVLRREPARRLLSLRETVVSFADAVALVGRLARLVPARVDKAALGQFVVIAHAAEFEPDTIVEMQFPIEPVTAVL
jgi:DNA-binding transcriptional MerR regulator